MLSYFYYVSIDVTILKSDVNELVTNERNDWYCDSNHLFSCLTLSDDCGTGGINPIVAAIL